MQRIRRSLVLKTAIVVATAATVPFLIAAVVLVRGAQSALYSEIVDRLDGTVALMGQILEARLGSFASNLGAWAGLEVMNDLLAEDLDKRVTVVLEGLKRDYDIDGNLHAVDGSGRIIASSDPSAIGRSIDVPAASGPLGIPVRDVHASVLDGEPSLTIGAPIRSRVVDRPIGTLLLEYHVRDLAQAVLSQGTPISAILGADGVPVAASAEWVPALAVAPNRREVGEYIVASTPPGEVGRNLGLAWTVAGAAKREVVLAPIARMGRLSAIAGFSGLALLLAFVAYAGGRTVRPITEVAAAADSMAETMDLSYRVPVNREDEVGRLGRAFNRMADEVSRQVDMLLDANLEMLEVLGSAIAKRDSDTSAHNYRVTLLAMGIAEDAGVGEAEMRTLLKGSFLHDIGKIGISDTILLKPGRLDAQEFAVMQTHVQHGADIVARHPWLADTTDVVQHHHERYDGRGYPDGLRGEAIPRVSRIFAIADVFDALTSVRPYKAAMPFDETIATMARDRGTHFDPELFDRFVRLAPGLYRTVSREDGAMLAERLRARMRAYFFEGRSPATVARG